MIEKIKKRFSVFGNLINLVFSNEVIIVYQMGKVGSTSLYESLKKQSKLPVFQLHRFRLDNPHYVYRGSLRTIQRKIWAKILWLLVKRKEIKAISPVREPISRNASDFFQTFDLYKKKYGIADRDIEKAFWVFYCYYPHMSFETWFKLQVEDVFGIDIYEKPFDRESMHNVYSNDNIRLFIFRIEDIKLLSSSIGDFFGIKDFEIESSNLSSDKWYAPIYRDFKKHEMEPWYKEMMHSTQTYKFFYSESS